MSPKHLLRNDLKLAENTTDDGGAVNSSRRKRFRITIAILIVIVLVVATSILLLPNLTSRPIQTNVPANTEREQPKVFAIRKNAPANVFEHIHGLAVSQENQSLLFVATHTGLVVGFNSSQFQYDWYYVNDERMDITAVLLDAENPATLYTFGHPTANEETGIRKSVDGGRTWELVVSRPDPHQWIQSQSNPNIMYAVDFPTNVLIRTENRGVNWKILQSPATVLSIAVNPANTSEILAGTEKGLFMSSDGGSSWESFSERFSGVIVTAVAYDTRNPDVIYLRSFFGVMKSFDGGKSWKDIGNGIDAQDVVQYITVDNKNPDVVYAAAQDKIYKSVNGGDTWVLIRASDS